MVTTLLTSYPWEPVVMALARAVGLTLLLPLGWEVVGITQRLALALAFALGVPINHSETLTVTASLSALVLSATQGALLGLPIAIASDVAASMGEVLDSGRGMMIAELIDPISAQATSYLSLFFRTAVWVCFLTLGGMNLLIEAFAQQAALGMGSGTPTTGVSAAAVGAGIMQTLGQMFATSLVAIAPACALFLASELVIVLVTRAASNISFTTEATVMRVVLSLAVVVVAVDQLGELGRNAIEFLPLTMNQAPR